MVMYQLTVNPTLFHIGPLEVRYYGLIYVFGFLLVYWIMLKRRKELELTKDQVESFIVHIILGVVIGSRLGEVLLWNPGYYLQNPLQVLMIWRGGMAFHGGLIGAVLAGWLFSRKNKVDFAKLADIVALPAVFVLAIGRIGNFINQEIWGTVTNVSWCFKVGDECRHPYQIYAFLKRMGVFFILFGLTKVRKFKDGFIFWMMVLLMGIGRVLLDFLREDTRYFGMSLGQWFSLVMVVTALYVLMKYYSAEFSKSK